MHEMQLLSTYRDDQAELTPERFEVLRAQFEEHLIAAPSRRAPRTWAQRRFVFAAAGVAVVACTTVAVVTAGPAPQASAAAVRLLDGAATTAQANAAAGEAGTLVIREDALGMDGDTDPISAGYIARTVTTLHVPAGTGRWTRSTYSLPTVTFFGGAAGRAFEQRDNTGNATKDHPSVETSADGSFTVGELGGRHPDVFGSNRQSFRALPTDPIELLHVLRTANLGADPDPDQAEHVMTAATLVLDSGVANGNLQAAVFRALQQQPGLTVTDQTVDLNGRTGTAIGIPAADEKTETFQLILAPDTGQYLGHREVSLVPTGRIPAGTVLDSTAITQQ